MVNTPQQQKPKPKNILQTIAGLAQPYADDPQRILEEGIKLLSGAGRTIKEIALTSSEGLGHTPTGTLSRAQQQGQQQKQTLEQNITQAREQRAPQIKVRQEQKQIIKKTEGERKVLNQSMSETMKIIDSATDLTPEEKAAWKQKFSGLTPTITERIATQGINRIEQKAAQVGQNRIDTIAQQAKLKEKLKLEKTDAEKEAGVS